MMSAAATGGEIRMDRVAEIRAQIANGNYDSAEKMDAAVGRMLDQFA
jgi:negative regulator of flagellin synthesis FlgM